MRKIGLLVGLGEIFGLRELWRDIREIGGDIGEIGG